MFSELSPYEKFPRPWDDDDTGEGAGAPWFPLWRFWQAIDFQLTQGHAFPRKAPAQNPTH